MTAWRCAWALLALAGAACSQAPSKNGEPSDDQTASDTSDPGDAADAGDKAGGQAPEPTAAPAENPRPDETAIGFYVAYLKLPVGGVPAADGRAKLAPYITPPLEQLLIDASAAEARHDTATRGDAPPLIEGDPFTSLFEGATAFDTPVCKEQPGGTASCKVKLTHADAGGASVRWTDTADLVQLGGDWRVDDIEYGGTGGNFGNKGRLTELLKSAIKQTK